MCIRSPLLSLRKEANHYVHRGAALRSHTLWFAFSGEQSSLLLKGLDGLRVPRKIGGLAPPPFREGALQGKKSCSGVPVRHPEGGDKLAHIVHRVLPSHHLSSLSPLAAAYHTPESQHSLG